MDPLDAFVADVPANSTSERRVVQFGFHNTYARLPDRFYTRLNPTPVVSPHLIKVNASLAGYLGIDPLAIASTSGVDILAGNRLADGAEPLAMAYAGHQFGYFVPQLGDGRANLLGEVLAVDGVRYDVQLKGAGPTPFSRRGDGRASLGPVLREYLVSEAMAALGVPTTRALAAVTTGEHIFRETSLPGAVLTRVAASHLRIGTFQYFAAKEDTDALRTLANYAIARHYPEAAQAHRPYQAFLAGVIERQAHLVAQWMLLGFVHGVMNTDNISISGETIDYGPCAFMEAYDPETVFSSIDYQGRYAYTNQPNAMHWNLTRLAEALLPLLADEEGSAEAGLLSAKETLAAFDQQYRVAYAAGLRRKLGFFTERDGDMALAADLLERMALNRADFTSTFRALCHAAANENDVQARSLFADPNALDAWAAAWRLRLAEEPISGEERATSMRLANPAFIPRNHLVEAALRAAIERQDFTAFEKLLDVVSCPYQEMPGSEHYALAARPEECVTATFCGT